MRRTAPQEEAPSLGDLVFARREMLHLSVAEAARRADVSRETWTAIEKGRRPNSQAATLDAMDDALEWERGTLRSMIGRSSAVAALVQEPLAPPGPDALWINRAHAVIATLSGDQIRLVVRYAELVSQHGMINDGIHSPTVGGRGASGEPSALAGDAGSTPRP